eukprot:SAG31_NODE_1093_length_9952_cov_16.099056_10_plen_189_part_00
MVQLEDIRQRMSYEGWIQKERRASKHNFKERYLRMVDGNLNFYDSRNSKLPRKVIALDSIDVANISQVTIRTMFRTKGSLVPDDLVIVNSYDFPMNLNSFVPKLSAVWRLLSGNTLAAYSAIFADISHDKNGLTRDDIRLRTSLNEKEIDQLYNLIDVDKDGVITQKEWTDAVRTRSGEWSPRTSRVA